MQEIKMDVIKNIMKLYQFTFLFILLFISCTGGGERPTIIFTNRIRNNTDTSFVLKIEDTSQNIVLNELILPNNFLDFCEYPGKVYVGIGCSDFGTISILFGNDKGFICPAINDNNLCIPQKDLTEDRVGTKIENGLYEITITQEDFNNAYDLP